MSFNFEKLDVYQKSIEFVEKIYSTTDCYPKKEMFGLISQFRKAAVSISLNIAEGSARTKKDFNRFLDMARGSVYEGVAILQISKKRDYITSKQIKDFRCRLIDIS